MGIMMELEDAVVQLKGWAAAFDTDGDFQTNAKRVRYRYESELMLECLRPCNLLRGGGPKLSAACRHALRISMSLSFPKHVNKQLRSIETPSVSILHRYDFAFDMANLLCERERQAKEF